MNRIFTITIFVIFNLTVFAQKQVYQLHPMLGDTLENDEIGKYNLFQDYLKDSINCLILYNDNDKFSLEGILDGTVRFRTQIEDDEMALQKLLVDKQVTSFDSVLIDDTTVLNILKKEYPLSDSLNIEMKFMSPEYLKTVKKEVRRKYWEELRKEVKRNQENGMLF